MAKQLNVNLAFTADTSQAAMQVKNLQTQLTNLMNTPMSKFGATLDKDLNKAVQSVAELSVHLKNATNVNTGNLDFTKLNQSIKKSGTSLQEYGRTLQSLGPQGQQAFLSLTQAVATSEVPIRRTNKLLHEMGTTLMNTARWQISSSILHGFMGAVQSAFGYAQDLNESLNNIRIVTNQNTDQMAKFAVEANKAAKALSTTTTQYTNASLIYYQQGLNDQQVKERTDITIKMANVARTSAEEVSNQMTAVWNNFADGSQTLEYYADAMTALGAATASSTEEIATGLEKFASIATTVGLSYEYATAALATVTDRTRQSAEVVGTAFKTLFARIQGLSLGETLEDGTTLNKYSEALLKVGIDIKDTNGNLKDMDVILDETAAKWKSLSKDQQVALAQTVAGVRQYNQFIALMSNWDYMEQNLNTVKNSAGTLQEQADIYAESWDAASKRVKAAAEDIYSSLIDDKFFIKILNNIEDILTFIDKLIDSLGGVKGILLTIGTIVTKTFSTQLAQGLTNLAHNTKMFVSSNYRNKQEEDRRSFIDKAAKSMVKEDYDNGASNVDEAQYSSFKSQLTLQQEYMANAEKMSLLEEETNKRLMDRSRILHELAVARAKEEQSAKSNVSNYGTNVRAAIAVKNNNNPQQHQSDLETFGRAIQNIQQTSKVINTINLEWQQFSSSMKYSKNELQQFKNTLTELGANHPELQPIIEQFNKIDLSSDRAQQEVEEVISALKALNLMRVDGLKDGIIPSEAHKDLDRMVQSIDEQSRAEIERRRAVEEGKKAQEGATASIKKSKGVQADWSDVLVKGASAAMNAAMACNMVNSALTTLSDPDVSGWEKFTTVLMTLGMTIPTIINLFNTFSDILKGETLAKIANAAATMGQVRAEHQLAVAKGEVEQATVKGTLKNIGSSIGNKVTGVGQTIKNLPGAIANNWNTSVWSGLNADQQKFYLDQFKSNNSADDIWNNLTDNQRSSYMQQFAGAHPDKYRPTKKGGWGSIGAKGGKGSQDLTNEVAKGAKDLALDDAAATGGQKMAGANAAKTMGAQVGGGLLIAAGVAMAAAAIKIGIDSYNKYADAAKEAGEASRLAAEEARQAADAYNSFNSSTDQWSQQVKSLDDLNKGTDEYQAGILQANQAAMDLLNTYDGLTYKMSEQHRGLIEITNLEEVRAKQLEEMERKQSYSTFARTRANTAQLESDETDLLRKVQTGGDAAVGVGNTLAATGAGAASGAAVGAGIALIVGSIVPVIGNAVGAGVGAAIGAVAGAVSGLATGIIASINSGAATNAEREKLDKIYEVYKDGGDTRQEIINQFKLNEATDKEMIDAIYKQIVAMEQNTAAIKLSIEQQSKTANANNDLYQNLNEEDQSIMDKIIATDTASTLADKDSEEYKNARKEAKKLFDWGDQDAYDEYLKLRYGDDASNYRVTNQGGTAGTLQKRNADGTWENVGEKDSLTNDEVIDYIAEQRIIQADQDHMTTLEQINKIGDQAGNITGVTDDQIYQLKASLAEDGDIDLTSWTPEQVKAFKENLENTEHAAHTYGPEQYYDLIDALNNYDEDAHYAKIRQDEIDKVISLASAYEGCADAITNFQSALASGNDALIASAEDTLKMETAAEEAAEKFKMSAEELKVQATQMAEAYGISKEEAVQVAIKNQRMNDGVDELKASWADWKKELKATDKTTESYAHSVVELTKSVKKLVGVSEDFEVPEGFIDSVETMELLDKAAEGSAEAIAMLGVNLAKASIQALQMDTIALMNTTQVGFDPKTVLNDVESSFDTLRDRVLNGNPIDELLDQTNYGMDAFASAVANGTLKAGDSVDMLNDQWIKDFNDMAYYSNMSVQDVKDTLSAMNISAKVKVTRVESGTSTTPIINTYTRKLGPSELEEGWEGTQTYSEEVGQKEVKAWRDVPSISFDGDPETPDITYTGAGSYSPPSPPKSSGGGGSSKKTKKKSDEVERYHKIDKELEYLRKQYDAVAKAKDRAFGKDKIALIEKEILLLEQEARLQQQYLDEIEGYYKSDLSAIVGYGAQVDEDGVITNYDDLVGRYVDMYNSGQITDEEYEAFKKALSQYEDTWTKWLEESANAIDKANAIFDAKLEKIKVNLELEINIQDDQLEYINYQLEKMDNAAYDAAESLALLGQQATAIQNRSNATAKAIADIFANHGIENWQEAMNDPEALSQLTDAEITELRNLRTSLLNDNKELMALKDQAIDLVISAFDDWNEQMDRHMAKIEHYNSILTSFNNIVELVGQSTLGISDEVMANMTEANVKIANNQLEASKAKMDALRKEEAEVKRRMSELDPESEEYKMLEKVLEHIEEQTDAAEEEMMANWENALQAAADAFEAAVDRTINAFEKALAGTYGTLEELQAGFDQATEISERYVADYKEIYELSKLNRDILNSIDETDNIKAKRALRDLQKEINELQNSNVQMTEYDLEHLRAKYELRLAEIALEEAQDAKSQVRMRRDSEGNYSYVFTADQAKIDEAQQNYEDKLYEMQELNSEYIKEMQNNILQSEIELANALRELDRTKFASDEEYYAKVNELTQYYTGQRNYYLEQMNNGITNNQELVNQDWANYSAATGYRMSADQDYVDSFTETTYAQITGYESIQAAQTRFTEATRVMVEDLRTAFQTWQANVDSAMAAAGTSTEQFAEDMSQAVYGEDGEGGIVGASEDAADAVSNIGTEMGEVFSEETLAGLSTFAEEYVTYIKPLIEQNEAFVQTLNDIITARTNLQSASTDNPLNVPEGDGDSGSSEGGSGADNPYGLASAANSSIKSIQWALKHMGYNLGNFGPNGDGIDGYMGAATKAAVKQFQEKAKEDGYYSGYIDGIPGKLTRAAFAKYGYKTGGLVDYTGMAWLDGTPNKPEYVLNAVQTQGFLRLIDLLDSNYIQSVQEQMMLTTLSIDRIARIIDLNAGAHSLGLGTLDASNRIDNNQIVEQEVTIHAEFPNAVDHNEIEEAFNTLINRASQFANRKKL